MHALVSVLQSRHNSSNFSLRCVENIPVTFVFWSNIFLVHRVFFLHFSVVLGVCLYFLFFHLFCLSILFKISNVNNLTFGSKQHQTEPNQAEIATHNILSPPSIIYFLFRCHTVRNATLIFFFFLHCECHVFVTKWIKQQIQRGKKKTTFFEFLHF